MTSKVSNPAGLLRRIAAFLYDFLLLLAIYFVIGGIAVTINGGEAIAQSWSALLLFLLFLVVAFVFYYWFWTHNGQTLGMQAWRLRLQANNGHLDLPTCLLRFLMYLITVASGGVLFLWILVAPESRSPADIVSKTRVVKLPPASAMQSD